MSLLINKTIPKSIHLLYQHYKWACKHVAYFMTSVMGQCPVSNSCQHWAHLAAKFYPPKKPRPPVEPVVPAFASQSKPT